MLRAIPFHLAFFEQELTWLAVVLADPRGDKWRIGVLVYVSDSEQTVLQVGLLLEVIELAKVKGFITAAQARAAGAQLWHRKNLG